MNKKIIKIMFVSAIVLGSSAAAYAKCSAGVKVTCTSGGCTTEITVSCEQR